MNCLCLTLISDKLVLAAKTFFKLEFAYAITASECIKDQYLRPAKTKCTSHFISDR